jgi:SAM-dependent methyltransferase
MSALGRLWLVPGRTRRLYLRARGRTRREELVRKYAPGRSFADIGCMWNANGANAFLAEDSGATAVTAVDLIRETPEFQAEHERRRSRVRFVHGDLYDPAIVGNVGTHDVVWCTGVMYHAPNPVFALEQLRDMTGELLIVDTLTVPEVPGIPNAAVFYPGLSERDRRVYWPTWPGEREAITTPFKPESWYGNWWWGLTPSAFRSMLGVVGLDVVEWIDEVFQVYAVARRVDR